LTKKEFSRYSTTELHPHNKPIINLNVGFDLKELAEELILIRGNEVSVYTITNMQSCYRQFFIFCDNDLNDEKKIKMNVLKFLKGKSNEYYNKQLQALRQLFAYAVEQEHIVKNPCLEMKYKQHSIKIVQHSRETIKNFLELPNTGTYAGLRDFVAMLTMLDCGIRPNELVQITDDCIDTANNFIQIQEHVSKTRQFRFVPISEYTMRHIKKLIKINQQNFDTKNIFNTYRGEQLNTKELRYRFNQYSKQLGVSITPYAFRHCFALLFLKKSGQNGAFSLQKIMGHSKLDMTKTYIALAESDIAEAHKQASPVMDMFTPTKKEKRILKI